jgi:hypothetical protein
MNKTATPKPVTELAILNGAVLMILRIGLRKIKPR